MSRRDLTALLRAAARDAMPADQALRFSRFLRGLEGREPPDVVPGTPWLPPVTIDRPSPPPKPARAMPLTSLECDWHYGGECGCGNRVHRRPKRDAWSAEYRQPRLL